MFSEIVDVPVQAYKSLTQKTDIFYRAAESSFGYAYLAVGVQTGGDFVFSSSKALMTQIGLETGCEWIIV